MIDLARPSRRQPDFDGQTSRRTAGVRFADPLRDDFDQGTDGPETSPHVLFVVTLPGPMVHGPDREGRPGACSCPAEDDVPGAPCPLGSCGGRNNSKDGWRRRRAGYRRWPIRASSARCGTRWGSSRPTNHGITTQAPINFRAFRYPVLLCVRVGRPDLPVDLCGHGFFLASTGETSGEVSGATSAAGAGSAASHANRVSAFARNGLMRPPICRNGGRWQTVHEVKHLGFDNWIRGAQQ